MWHGRPAREPRASCACHDQVEQDSAVTSRRDEMFIDTKVHQIRNSRFIGERIVSLLEELNTLIESTRSINVAPLCGAVVAVVLTMNSWAAAQNPLPNSETPKKANARPAESARPKPDPFEGASIEK